MKWQIIKQLSNELAQPQVQLVSSINLTLKDLLQDCIVCNYSSLQQLPTLSTRSAGPDCFLMLYFSFNPRRHCHHPSSLLLTPCSVIYINWQSTPSLVIDDVNPLSDVINEKLMFDIDLFHESLCLLFSTITVFRLSMRRKGVCIKHSF